MNITAHQIVQDPPPVTREEITCTPNGSGKNAIDVNILSNQTGGSGGLPVDSLIKGQLDDLSTNSVAEDDFGYLRITPKRALHSNLRDNAGNEISSYSGTGISGQVARGLNTAGVFVGASFLPIGEMAGTSITGSFQSFFVIGVNKIYIMTLANGTNRPIYISADAVNNHFRLEQYSSMTFDFASGWQVLTAITFYIKHAGIVPTRGSVCAMPIIGPSGE